MKKGVCKDDILAAFISIVSLEIIGIFLFFIALEYEEQSWLFPFSGLFSVFTGFFFLYKIATHPYTRFNFLLLISAIYLITIPGGAVNTYLNIEVLDINWVGWLRAYRITNADVIWTFIAFGLFSLFSTIIGFWLQISTTIIDQVYSQTRDYLKNNKKVLFYLNIIVGSIQLFLIGTGVISLQGQDINTTEVNPLLSFILPIICIVVVSSAFYLNEKNAMVSTKEKYIFSFLFFLQIFWFFLCGRRQIIYLVLLAVFGFFYSQKITLKFVLSKAIPIFIVLIITVQAINFYQMLRVAGVVQMLTGKKKASFGEIYEVVRNIDGDRFREANQQNLAFRTFTSIVLVAQFNNLYTHNRADYLYGEDIINNFLKTLPSNYIVDKTTIYTQELLYNKRTQGLIGTLDLGDTIVLESFADFGLVGAGLVYPIIFASIMLLFYLYAGVTRFAFESLCIQVVFANTALNLLESAANVFFLSVRLILIVIIISLFFRTLYSNIKKNKKKYAKNTVTPVQNT
jgi:hypothetical protein